MSVWTDPTTDARLKKRIVRIVIHEVIADIDTNAAEIVLLIHWVGGVHTEIRLPRRWSNKSKLLPPHLTRARNVTKASRSVRQYGPTGDALTLVAHGAFQVFNPTLPQRVIDRALDLVHDARARQVGGHLGLNENFRE